DHTIEVGPHCSFSTSIWLGFTSLLIIFQILASFYAFMKWRSRNNKRKRQNAGKPSQLTRNRYWFRRRLPVLPFLIMLITLTSLFFWILATRNVINAENGWTYALFSVHIFAGFLLLHFYLFRFVRIGLKITPLSRQLQKLRMRSLSGETSNE